MLVVANANALRAGFGKPFAARFARAGADALFNDLDRNRTAAALPDLDLAVGIVDNDRCHVLFELALFAKPLQRVGLHRRRFGRDGRR
ncbi:hypothetical protein [Aquimonas sp.]|uniref:hypothetical protein n=1 Tax=Aquimonas sp. TaxID=1872588 RepID=UPI0037C19F0A